jgi:hypothetical protein
MIEKTIALGLLILAIIILRDMRETAERLSFDLFETAQICKLHPDIDPPGRRIPVRLTRGP